MKLTNRLTRKQLKQLGEIIQSRYQTMFDKGKTYTLIGFGDSKEPIYGNEGVHHFYVNGLSFKFKERE